MPSYSSAAVRMSSTQASSARRVVRCINILVHGVNTDAAWFGLVEKAMTAKSAYVVLPFSWGDYENRKQGGHPNYAADEVIQLFKNGAFSYDRIYQGHSAVRLKELIDACRKLVPQVNVIAHSNGTLLTAAALLLGARLDNYVMMGSPLDCDNSRSQKELSTALENVSGKVYNFWSPKDEWAQLKGGIGAFGNNSTYRSANPGINNIEFVPGSQLQGVKIVATGKDVIRGGPGRPPLVLPNFGHSDYMLKDHMQIFVKYIEEFAKSGKGGLGNTLQVEEQQLTSLRQQADWTRVSYYTSKKNVTLDSPDMKKYKKEIDQILK
jgi:hypothetical protein